MNMKRGYMNPPKPKCFEDFIYSIPNICKNSLSFKTLPIQGKHKRM